MDEPRLVLFGAPSAGKSSLLGALVQAAEGQEHALKGKLSDRSQKLGDLRQAHGQNRLQPTTEEIVSYPIAVEPDNNASRDRQGASEAVLIDCAGKSAQEILSGKQAWPKQRGDLAGAIRSADTLILVVDAAADAAQLQKDFGQLANFVRNLEQNRSSWTEIAGLPVYVVLSKCDLLARKGDTTSAWIQRIEERKRQVDQAFQKFLAQQTDRDRLTFGKVELHFWATAARRPALADRPTPDQQPYGVAELFRQCLQEARDFHHKEARSSKRLQALVASVTGLLAVMGLLAAAVWVTRPSPEVISLENSLHGLLPAEGAKPADRLKEPLDDKLKQLRKIQKNPNFPQLAVKTQDDVEHYIKEIEAYQDYNRDVLKKIQDPRLATTEEELAAIEKGVKELSPPKEYVDAWKDTRVERRSQLWLKDTQAIRDQGAKIVAWIDEQIKAGKTLEKEGFRLRAGLGTPEEREKWLASYKVYMDQPLPYRAIDRPPGAGTITYATVYQFQPVQRARQNWDEFKKGLKTIRDGLVE